MPRYFFFDEFVARQVFGSPYPHFLANRVCAGTREGLGHRSASASAMMALLVVEVGLVLLHESPNPMPRVTAKPAT